MHWIYLIHKFRNLSWITEINELFHDILIYWDAPACKCIWSILSMKYMYFKYTLTFLFFTRAARWFRSDCCSLFTHKLNIECNHSQNCLIAFLAIHNAFWLNRYWIVGTRARTIFPFSLLLYTILLVAQIAMTEFTNNKAWCTELTTFEETIVLLLGYE